jgi:hypothetical protein
MHNVRVGTRMVELAMLQLVQLVGVKSTARGPTNQEAGAPPPPGFPHIMLVVVTNNNNSLPIV